MLLDLGTNEFDFPDSDRPSSARKRLRVSGIFCFLSFSLILPPAALDFFGARVSFSDVPLFLSLLFLSLELFTVALAFLLGAFLFNGGRSECSKRMFWTQIYCNNDRVSTR